MYSVQNFRKYRYYICTPYAFITYIEKNVILTVQFSTYSHLPAARTRYLHAFNILSLLRCKYNLWLNYKVPTPLCVVFLYFTQINEILSTLSEINMERNDFTRQVSA